MILFLTLILFISVNSFNFKIPDCSRAPRRIGPTKGPGVQDVNISFLYKKTQTLNSYVHCVKGSYYGF